MKKCPTCQKTFDDNLRFCQSDGTPLVEDAPPPDPYATMVASKDEIMSAIPDGRKIRLPLLSPTEDDDDLLDIPEESDSMKTMFVTDAERKEMFDEPSSKPIPPPTFGQDDLLGRSAVEQYGGYFTGAARTAEIQRTEFESAEFRRFVIAALRILRPRRQVRRLIMNRRHLINSRFRAISTRRQNRMTVPLTAPIPSPFGEQMPPSYQAPTTPPFEPPEFKVEEVKAEQLNTPFAEDVAQGNQQMAEQSWTPPAAPEQSWENQEIGQNTPFQPPPAGVGGENKTLAIVSLVLGILSHFLLLVL